MPETPLNPFREEPTGLNPNSSEFFKEFVPDYEPDEAGQPDQAKQAPTPEPENTPTEGLVANAEEQENFENELVKCAGIEITRKQERQINEIIKNLNAQRQQNGLEKVELGNEIKLHKITIGGKTKEQLEQEIKKQSNEISHRAQQMLNSPDFITQEQKEQSILIRLTVEALGFPQGATTEEIFNKAQEMGMELCPAETGPQFRLQYQDQPMNEWVCIGMKQITDSDGELGDVYLVRNAGGLLQLDGHWAEPSHEWRPGDAFVFRPASLR